MGALHKMLSKAAPGDVAASALGAGRAVALAGFASAIRSSSFLPTFAPLSSTAGATWMVVMTRFGARQWPPLWQWPLLSDAALDANRYINAQAPLLLLGGPTVREGSSRTGIYCHLNCGLGG